jgi:putative ABC transport system substrate-binding protein
MLDVRRREFIALLSGAAAACPFTARAQQTTPPTIGFLGPNNPVVQREWTAAFVQRLRELGWSEGRNIVIEYRWADGRVERSAELANELVRLKVDVLVAAGSAVAVAAKQATSVIPIIFPIAGDPVDIGLVASLARPGGNVTGLSLQKADLAAKRLEILRETVSGLHRLAILANAAYRAAVLEMDEVRMAAKTLGLDTSAFEVRQADDIAGTFEALKSRAEALFVCADPLLFENRVRISILALGARMPTIYDNRQFVEVGGLISYGPNFPDMFRRAGDYVDKILRGAKPADLPVEQPTKFDLVINLKTAKSLGLEIPPILLARADEVIE